MTVDYDDLRAKALAATPGPWQWWTSNSWRRLTAHAANGSWEREGDVLCPVISQHDRHPDLSVTEANMEYIAAANPATVLSLLDEIAALRKTMLDRDEQWLDMIALCDEHMAKIETPMESPSTDAWMTVSKNLGLARVVIESRHAEATACGCQAGKARCDVNGCEWPQASCIRAIGRARGAT